MKEAMTMRGQVCRQLPFVVPTNVCGLTNQTPLTTSAEAIALLPCNHLTNLSLAVSTDPDLPACFSDQYNVAKVR